MKMKNFFMSMNLLLYSTAFAMELDRDNLFKNNDKECFRAIDEFIASTKGECDNYRYIDYADAVKSAVAFNQNMNRVTLSCELAKIRQGVATFPLFIVMAKEKRCTILLEIMLQRGADPNMCHAAQYKVARPLSEAIIYNALDNARLLLRFGAKPRVELKLRSNDPDKDPRLSLLLEYGAKPEEIWAGKLVCTKEPPVITEFSNLSLE